MLYLVFFFHAVFLLSRCLASSLGDGGRFFSPSLRICTISHQFYPT